MATTRTQTRSHTCFDGFVIAYEAPPDTDAFLARVRRATEDPSIDSRGLFALVYSEDNPILTPRPEAGRGFLTRDSLADPLYVVLQDLLFRKRVACAGRTECPRRPEARTRVFHVERPVAGPSQKGMRTSGLG